jgi:hypothetical protein
LSLNRCGNDRSKECFTTFTTSDQKYQYFFQSINLNILVENHPTTETIADCKLKEADKPIYVPAPPKILSVLKGFQLRRKQLFNNQ